MKTMVRLGSRLPDPIRRVVRNLPGARWLRDRAVGTPRPGRGRPGDLRAVVYLPTWSEWDVMRQRQQYLMAAFAALGHPAYFVDQKVSGGRVVDGVHVVPSLDDVPGEDVILYVHFAPVRPLFAKFTRPVVAYDILDDLSIYEPDEARVPRRRRVAAHHSALMENADVVTVSAPVLADRHRAERADLILVPNGVDFDRFSAPAARPADLPVGAPLVGYHGALGDWFAFDLAMAVARAMPEWHFAMVGPVYPRVASRAAELAALPNVTLLGERPSDQMPAYVQGFDVCAIWFSVNHLTEAVTPLKMYETMAAARPCVSTPLPAALAAPTVHTAADAGEFVAALQSARAEADDPAFVMRARAAGAAAAWTARVEPLRERLDSAGKLRIPG